MESKVFFNLVSRIFGFIIFIIGVLNILRGNDQLLGVAFMLISFIYVPNANKIIKKNLGFSIHYVAKIVLAILSSFSDSKHIKDLKKSKLIV